MLSPDLAPDLQYVGSDVPFYEAEHCKKEMSYYDLQPIQAEQNQYIIPNNTSILDYIIQSQTSQDLPWESASASWQTKPPIQWVHTEVLDWLLHWSKQTGIDLLEINMREFNRMSGQELFRLSQNEFCNLDPQYGNMLYQSLQNEAAQHYQPSPISLEIPTSSRSETENPLPAFHTWSNDTYSQLFNVVGSDIQGSSPSSSHDSDREDRESTSSSMSTANEKTSPTAAFYASAQCADILDGKKEGRRGRPPKTDSRSRSRQGKGNGKLWEFIRDLLLNPATNPSLIRWERPEDGIFKFVQSDRVAKMWGDRKQNPRMTYEKLSRAMRTYYSSGILLPVPKTEGLPKKLIYKFAPQALKGWH